MLNSFLLVDNNSNNYADGVSKLCVATAAMLISQHVDNFIGRYLCRFLMLYQLYDEFGFFSLKAWTFTNFYCQHTYWGDCLSWNWLWSSFRNHRGLCWNDAFRFLGIGVVLVFYFRGLLLSSNRRNSAFVIWWIPSLPLVAAGMVSAASCCDCRFSCLQHSMHDACRLVWLWPASADIQPPLNNFSPE